MRLYLCVVGIIVCSITGTKSEVGCTGCHKVHNPQDESLRRILQIALRDQNSRAKKSNEEPIEISTITNVQTKTVSGTEYTFDFIGKGKNSNKEYNCQAVLLRQVWVTPKPQILEFNCS